jgi:hypothetical protein
LLRARVVLPQKNAPPSDKLNDRPQRVDADAAVFLIKMLNIFAFATMFQVEITGYHLK